MTTLRFNEPVMFSLSDVFTLPSGSPRYLLANSLDLQGLLLAGNLQPCAHLVHLFLAGALPAQPLLVHAPVQVVLTGLGQELVDTCKGLHGIQGAYCFLFALQGWGRGSMCAT